MKLRGEQRFAVGRQELWRALLDPGLLVRVLPGCEPLEPVGEHAWRAAMTMKVGPVQGRFSGTLALSDLVEATSYRMKVDGSGPSGFMQGEGTIALADAEGGTLLSYEVDAKVGGRVASVGQRLIESSGRAIAKQGLEGLERELAAREAAAAAAPGAPESAPPSPPSPPAPPSTTVFVARFARGLFRELPVSWRVAIVLGGLALLVALALLLRGC